MRASRASKTMVSIGGIRILKRAISNVSVSSGASSPPCSTGGNSPRVTHRTEGGSDIPTAKAKAPSVHYAGGGAPGNASRARPVMSASPGQLHVTLVPLTSPRAIATCLRMLGASVEGASTLQLHHACIHDVPNRVFSERSPPGLVTRMLVLAWFGDAYARSRDGAATRPSPCVVAESTDTGAAAAGGLVAMCAVPSLPNLQPMNETFMDDLRDELDASFPQESRSEEEAHAWARALGVFIGV